MAKRLRDGKGTLGWPNAKELFGNLPGGGPPSITGSTLRTFSRHIGVTEEEGLKIIEEMAGQKIQVIEPTEPFVVVVSDYLAVATSRPVKCALCERDCWAAEEYGPLATYLCIDCAQQGDLDKKPERDAEG